MLVKNPPTLRCEVWRAALRKSESYKTL